MELTTEEYERRARRNIEAAGKAPTDQRPVILAAGQIFATLAVAAAYSGSHDALPEEKRGPGRPRKETTDETDRG